MGWEPNVRFFQHYFLIKIFNHKMKFCFVGNLVRKIAKLGLMYSHYKRLT